jgi:hypothetical protein
VTTGILGTVAEPLRTPARRGAGRDLLEFFAVGGATLVLFPLSWLLRRALGLDEAELAVGFSMFYLAYVINDPHFAVTYLLFYRDARRRALSPDVGATQRARWLLAGVIVPVTLVVWAIAALRGRSAPTLGWMIQLMYLTVGWHYVKQGFGVLAVLSARRGVTLLAQERAVILAHAYLGWAYGWANPASPAREFEERGVVYTGVAHPRWLEVGTGALLAASGVAIVVLLVLRWRRERRTLPLAPLGGFLITIWAWTIYSGVDPLVRYVIPALHSIQYLYFVWLMKRNEARAEEGPPSFGRPVHVRVGALLLAAIGLGWLLFHGAPDFLDAAFVSRAKVRATVDPLGETPFVATFYVFVNVHHFFMDHVIWRRENPDTRWLRA